MDVSLDEDPLRDKDYACEFLSIGRWHLEALIRRREISFTKVGRLVRFRHSDLVTYRDAHRIEAI